jgi:hypothetical protein
VEIVYISWVKHRKARLWPNYNVMLWIKEIAAFKVIVVIKQ